MNGLPLAADLLEGKQDPRSSVVGLLRRALAALPPQATQATQAAETDLSLDEGLAAWPRCCAANDWPAGKRRL